MLDTHKRRTADLRQTEAKLLHIKMKVLDKDDQPPPKNTKLHLSAKDSNEEKPISCILLFYYCSDMN